MEAHNLRSAKYLAGLKKAGRSIYFFEDQTHLNKSWVNPAYKGKTCEEIQKDLIELYKQKVGQKPQLQDRTRINKKTGKEYTVSGWSPIREGVIPIRKDTTLEDFDKIKSWAMQKGINIIRIDIHHDEGYRNETTGETKHNRHAHVVFDWVDHNTGKTLKLDDKDMSVLQDVVANSLQMERGTKKEETGLKHIEHIEYREKKAEGNVSKLQTKTLELEDQRDKLQLKQFELRTSNLNLEKALQEHQNEIKELEEKASSVRESTETALNRLNAIKADIATSEKTKSELEQITSELENALKPTYQKQNQTYAALQEKHTKTYLFGSVKGATDFEAVADELWQQQRDGETCIVRNEFLQVRKYLDERDNAVKERDEANEKLKELQSEYNSLINSVIQSLGERFARFWADMKRVSQNFVMALGLWQGETWNNKRKKETYTADQTRCVLLINGKSQDEREKEFTEKAEKVYKETLETCGEGWTSMRFKKLSEMKDYNDRVRELEDIIHVAQRDIRRGRGLGL